MEKYLICISRYYLTYRPTQFFLKIPQIKTCFGNLVDSYLCIDESRKTKKGQVNILINNN